MCSWHIAANIRTPHAPFWMMSCNKVAPALFLRVWLLFNRWMNCRDFSLQYCKMRSLGCKVADMEG